MRKISPRSILYNKKCWNFRRYFAMGKYAWIRLFNNYIISILYNIWPLFRYDHCRWSEVLAEKYDHPRNRGAPKTCTSKRLNSSSCRIAWTHYPSRVSSSMAVDCFRTVRKTFCSVNKMSKKCNKRADTYIVYKKNNFKSHIIAHCPTFYRRNIKSRTILFKLFKIE